MKVKSFKAFDVEMTFIILIFQGSITDMTTRSLAHTRKMEQTLKFNMVLEVCQVMIALICLNLKNSTIM